MSYQPQFTITAQAINLISEISAKLERYAIRLEQADGVKLRKINRMKTIRGSLAIEGNSLTEEQVTALIEGRHVIAPIREVQEVRNAIKAYDKFMDFDPYKIEDLLLAHEIMALGLLDSPGHFRKIGVCVAGREGITHIAPPANMVSSLMSDLFEWVRDSKDHILIKSSIFHYDFEFIHPFEDGNGRLGRFWQSLFLSKWKPIFANLPIENMIWENQAEYYKAIEQSTKETDSGIFVEFMLGAILKSINNRANLNDLDSDLDNDLDNDLDGDLDNDLDNDLENAIKQMPTATYAELAKKIGKSESTVKRGITKLKKQNIICRVGTDRNGYWKIL
jgi:hypothetical protein